MDQLTKMEAAGRAAAQEGRPCAPALCSVYMAAIDRMKPGARRGRHTAVSLARAWVRGYHSYRLNEED